MPCRSETHRVTGDGNGIGDSAPIVVGDSRLRRAMRNMVCHVRPWSARFARQLWSAWWVVAFTVVVQVFFVPWQTTAFNAVRVLELVMIANLVTLTTRTEDMLDTVLAALRPLRRFGVNPDRIGLLCALTISAIPLINRNVRIVREANQARGGHGGVTAWAVPLLVLILKQSDELADALDSRGL